MEIVSQGQEAQRVLYRINPRRHMPRHIVIKLTKIKHKERILKAARDARVLQYTRVLQYMQINQCDTIY